MSITFDEVMAFHPGNHDVYEEIRDSVDQLLPFVGAGLTAPVYGTWTGTLRALGKKIARQSIRDEVSSMIDCGDYLGAAQFLENKRTAFNLAHDLAHHFSRKKLEDRWETVQNGALWLLPDLFECPVLTTNFDEAIETVYPSRGAVPFPILDPTNGYLVNHATRLRDTACVFKLHGTVSGNMLDCSTLVLTQEQYDEHYADDGEVRKALKTFVEARSLFFLGCSLGADRTVDVLREATGAGVVHYAIVECAAGDSDERVMELADERIGELAGAHIRTILYRNRKHDSVRAVLERLRDEVGPKALKGSPSRTPQPTMNPVPSKQTSKLCKDSFTKLVDRINARLLRQQKGHPSFQLMNNSFDASLLPSGERTNENKIVDKARPIPNSKRDVQSESGKTVSFGDFIRKSWKGEQTHLFITGRGGIGKTIALLSFATEPGFLPKDVPTIYIPLYDLSQYTSAGVDCVDCYLERAFSEEERSLIQELSFMTWDGGPNVILLMDGHNEIPTGRRDGVEKGLRTWAERAGTQLVTTSRISGLFGFANTEWIELQELSKEVAKKHLKELGFNTPRNEDERLWQILKTPLMLRLYTDTSNLPAHLKTPYLRWEPSDSAGHLVWNYLQRELWRVVNRNKGDYDESEYAFAILLAIPYVCWRMEFAHEFKVSRDTLEEYIDDACVRWLNDELPQSFKDVLSVLRTSIIKESRRTIGNSLQEILTEETGLLPWIGSGYSLLHQNLRDGLAAIHLHNTIEAATNEIPPEFNSSFSEYVKDFLADLSASDRVENNPLIKLWESNRKRNRGHKGLTSSTVTHNLLRVIFDRFEGDLSMLNWSGMDLRGESLFPYRKDLQLRVSDDPSYFEDTILEAKCFKAQEHTGTVSSVRFSPDGYLLASGSADGSIRLWDVETGRLIHKMGGHGGRITSISFSPNGAMLASGSHDRTVRLWSTATGILIRKIYEIEGPVTSLQFSPNGTILATGSRNRTIKLWDTIKGKRNTVTGKPVRELKGHGGMVTSICFSPKGTLLASGSDSGAIELWNTMTGTLSHKYGSSDGWVGSVCFSPDGTLIAGGYDDGTVRLWSSVTRELVQVIKKCEGLINAVTFSPDGTLLAIGSDDGFLRLWDTTTSKLTNELGERGDRINSISFSPDGVLLASGSNDRTVRLWDIHRGQMLREFGGRGGGVVPTCFSPDGTIIVSGSHDMTVRLWDAKTGRLVRKLDRYSSLIRSVCFSHSRSLFASGSDDGSIHLWNTDTGCLIRTLGNNQSRIISISFSPSGTLLASGSDDGVIRLWNTETGDLVGNLEGNGSRINSVCFSPTGNLIASCSDAGIQLWNTSGNLVRTIWSHRGWINSVSFSPDASLLVSGSDDGVVQLWGAATGKPLHEFRDHSDWTTSVCFSPDGTLIASGSRDRTVRVWETSTGHRFRKFKCRDGSVWSVSFSPNGDFLLSSSPDGTIQVWSLYTKDGFSCTDSNYFTGTIEPLLGIDLFNLDISHAIIKDDHTRKVLYQNGAKVNIVEDKDE